jgi:orotidine-5'-phosphate decarboxylase
MILKPKYGIIIACDVFELETLKKLSRELADLDFLVGFKLGINLVLKTGLYKAVEVIREYTDKPLLYDHQKYGTDIPEVCGGEILKIIKETGIDGLIIFPHAGIKTLKATVNGCHSHGLTPIVGGVMTHQGFLVKEGGYIENSAPERTIRDAAKLGVEHFVLPGNQVELIRRLKEIIVSNVGKPKILFPGIGSGQGGSIKEAFHSTSPAPSYAIVGRGIYRSRDMRKAAIDLWKEVDDLLVNRKEY